MVYQDVDNYGDDSLSSFVQYQNAPVDSPLTIYGNLYPGLDQFYADAEAGILPLVSWIVGPAELSERGASYCTRWWLAAAASHQCYCERSSLQ